MKLTVKVVRPQYSNAYFVPSCCGKKFEMHLVMAAPNGKAGLARYCPNCHALLEEAEYIRD